LRGKIEVRGRGEDGEEKGREDGEGKKASHNLTYAPNCSTTVLLCCI